MNLLRVLRDLGLLALMVAWAVAAHYGSKGAGHPDLNVLVALVPFGGALVMALARVRSRILVAAGYAGGVALLVALWPTLRHNVALLYYLQHLGIHLALATLFGRSLLGPGEALITRMARLIFDGELSERNARYTRQVTGVWTLFFLANATISTGLFLFAPLNVWSVFANLLSGPMIGLMFACEHLWRMRVLPPEERPSIPAVVRAYRRSTARSAQPSSAS